MDAWVIGQGLPNRDPFQREEEPMRLRTSARLANSSRRRRSAARAEGAAKSEFCDSSPCDLFLDLELRAGVGVFGAQKFDADD